MVNNRINRILTSEIEWNDVSHHRNHNVSLFDHKHLLEEFTSLHGFYIQYILDQQFSKQSNNMEISEPKDSKNLVLVIMLIHGIGTLLPWNMFITADQYFKDKIDVNHNVTDGTEFRSEILISQSLQKNFMYYITISSKLPNVITQGINFMIQPKRESLNARIIWSIMIEAVIFAFTMILAIVDSSQWPNYFVAATLVSVVLINIANGVYQNCIYGVTALLPDKYTNSVVTGMNISGVVTSIAMIISVASTPDYRMSAIFYFLIAVIFLIICAATYYILPKNVSIWSQFLSSWLFIQEYFRHHSRRLSDSNNSNETIETLYEPEKGHNKPNNNLNPLDGPKSKWRKYIIIGKKTWIQLFNVFFVYFISLSIFPSVLVGIESSSGSLGKYFLTVTCFLSFNLFAMIGNILVDWIPIKIPAKYLFIPVIGRIFFIPFFLFCNLNPIHRTTQVWIQSDLIYSIGVVFLALTSGYFGSLAMIYTPKTLSNDHPEYSSVAGMMASFSLMIGIMSGIMFSILLTSLV